MNPIFRGIVIYLFLLIIFRLMGKRTLSEATTFDLVLLLIISEVTQQGLVGEDYSLTTTAILICTLMGIDQIFTLIKRASPMFGTITEGAPLVIVDKGVPLKSRMDKTKVDEADVMQSARQFFGLRKMSEIKYAVLERDGTITIIPYRESEKESKDK